MFRLVLLSCLLSGIALGEAFSIPTNEEVFMPVPQTTKARSIYAATDSKYYLYHIKVNWFQAFDLCFQMGQHLGTFNSEEEYIQLVKLIKDQNTNGVGSYWLGGSDLGERGKYIWNLTGRNVTYTNWWGGEPNHDNNNAEMEHCIDLPAEFHYYMNDNRCSIPNYVVCESP